MVMRLSLRSLKPTFPLALAACLGASSSGCFFGGGDGGGGYVPPGGGDDNPPAQPAQVDIDADATLQATPGDGVGVFVEYTTGGHWNVFTTCDFNTPANQGVSCGFDIFATVLDQGGAISNPVGQDLAGKDGIVLQGDGTVHLFTENTTGLNGMTFDTAPGATVELDVYLDGQEDPHFLYWVGKDVLHRGAPTIPVDFVPSEAPTTEPTGSGTTGSSSTGTH
jgi:hypothetical protein